jgi:acetyl-CoA synthetase
MFAFLCREGNDPDDTKQITYSELLVQVCKFANVLKAKGISKLLI